MTTDARDTGGRPVQNPWDRWPQTAPRGAAGMDTLAEERREVLDGIMESLRWGTGDAGARAACRLLLRHLAASPSHD